MKTLIAATVAFLSFFVWAQAPGRAAPPNRVEGRGPRLPEGAKALRDIPYVKGGHAAQVLDLYLPPGADAAAKPLPLVVWVHGGAWLAGNKAQCPALPLLGRGYAVASVEYRLSPVATFPAQIHDCKAAIRWLKANAQQYRLDPERIGAWGSSAGGHLVALLGTSAGVKEMDGDLGDHKDLSTRVACVVDFFGPTDFTRMRNSGRIDHDAANSPESKLIGGPVQQNKDKAAKANPITYIGKGMPPFLIMHGDKDETVPPNQSELLAEALKKNGSDVTYKVIEGAGHGFRAPEPTRMAFEFFDKWLKQG